MKFLIATLLAGSAVLSVANAADLYVEPEMVPEVVSAYDWSGGYVGIVGGYAWGDLALDDFAFADGGDGEGWLLGIEAGANWQMDAFVLGIEGDIAWTDISGDYVGVGPFIGDFELSWLGTLTARAGVAADKALFYVEAGAAFGELHTTVDAPGGPYDESAWSLGWTAGAGVEFALADEITAKVEYNYVDIGGFASDLFNSDYGITAHVVKAGLNFQF